MIRLTNKIIYSPTAARKLARTNRAKLYLIWEYWSRLKSIDETQEKYTRLNCWSVKSTKNWHAILWSKKKQFTDTYVGIFTTYESKGTNRNFFKKCPIFWMPFLNFQLFYHVLTFSLNFKRYPNFCMFIIFKMTVRSPILKWAKKYWDSFKKMELTTVDRSRVLSAHSTK